MVENSSPDHLPSPDLLKLTAQIVSAHVGHNIVKADDIPGLIRQVYQALCTARDNKDTVGPATAAPVRADRPEPAVQITKSVFPSYIVCLEDGKKLKMLKRHLQTSYGMTPEQYRAKWGLPPEYPMVAPDYAAKRSSLAKAIGLGTRSRGVDVD